MTSIERTAYPRFTRAPSVKELREIYTLPRLMSHLSRPPRVDQRKNLG